jgi:hypothetical protein
MNRRAIGKLIVLPVARMPVGVVLAALAWLALLALIPIAGLPGSALVGIATWLIGMLLGLTLRTLMRTESLLLPGFRRGLGYAGALYGIILAGVPAALTLFTGDPRHAALVGSIELFAAVLGLATGTGMRVTFLAWMVFPIMGFVPKPVQAALAHTVASSPWVPMLAALLALLILRLVMRPLLAIDDRADDESPMQAIADGRKPSVSADGSARYRGWIGKKLMPIMDATAARNLTHALARFQRRRNAASRMAVVRAVLLPHDNWQAVLITIAITAMIAGLYFLLMHHDAERWSAGVVASYAIIISMSRFTAAGRGMLKMRPNLADLYLALGPATQREFQATMAQALLKLVAVTTFNCLIYTVLIAILLHARAPSDLVLTALIVGSGTAFAALAAHLVGPTSQGGRMAMQMALMFGALIAFNLVVWLMHRFGIGLGALAALAICLPFGLGACRYAWREYLARRPCFDAPLE